MGYTALVTGANRGIGLGLVEQLASNPSIDIIFAAARNPAASSLVQLQHQYPSKIHPIPLEIINEDSAKQAVKQVSSILSPHRGLDILINNAGINQSYFGPIATNPLQDFTQTFQVNLLGVQNVTSEFLPLLRKG
jgi:NAD(P)-dependent dehydrogenase (short-subunit alcohol dehydrogenase family)